MIKKIKCPKCGIITTLEGNTDEIKSICCPNCGIKGNFKFPIDTETSKIIKEKTTRPLGITILAIFQIIAAVIMIIYLIVQPMFLDDYIHEIFGIWLIQFLILIIIVMIPIYLLLAYGLLKGKEWARFTSVLFLLSTVITTIISLNFFSVLIPIVIIYYLYQPHVKDFFKTEKRLKKNVKMLIICGIIILLIFNCYIALLNNPYVKNTVLKDIIISFREEQLIGTWYNTDRAIALQFNSNYTCIAKKDGDMYEGTWKINEDFRRVDLIWDIPFQLEHPNKPGYNYTIEQVYFFEQTIRLYITSISPTYSPTYYTFNKE
ncbi:hypothetical protein AYK24_02470 [Thermoplasmatales archaeon SG8-52-4]|nr:MAG: hypothetical protein AYK24_02470 [Thermoplasmatales archaeon SG8-52-4]